MPAKTLRVASGFLKGRVLILPDTKGTRPTKSIVKECVFNVLRYELSNAQFIEAFGGSASMAIEAISNGAVHAHVCEIAEVALKAARKNCEGLNISVYKGDAFALLDSIIAKIQASGNLAIVYLDPPFSIREGFSDIYSKLKNCAKGADMIIIEHESSQLIELDGFMRTSLRKFGRTSLSFYQPNNALDDKINRC